MSVSESDAKMQDDLASMMARNLHLGSMQPPVHDMSMPPTPQVVPQPTPITYISQHYHHSSHLAPSTPSDEVPASTILREAGVDSDALLPSQLQLFKNAESEQKQRLIELWKFFPPTYGEQLSARDMGNWPQTSMEQEEQAARERWEKQEQERLQNLSTLPTNDTKPQAEPYMANGYEPNNTYKQSNDPAYQSREWWTLTDDEPMEHQYGMLQQLQMQYQSSFHNVCDRDEMMT